MGITVQKKRRRGKAGIIALWQNRRLGNRIGEILLHSHFITEEQLATGLEEQRKSKKHLGTILIQQGIITPNILIEILRKQFRKKIYNSIFIALSAIMCF